jgi:hypothetical protein
MIIEFLKFAIGVIILLGLGVTSALYLMFGINYTISQTVSQAASDNPAFACFLSFLLGHWLMPMRVKK